MDKFFPRLRALRAKLKSLYLLSGFSRLLAEVLLYLVALYLLDRYVVLPTGVRVVLLGLALLALVWRVNRLLVYPVKKAIRVEDMALAVEHRHRELEGGLASAVELSRIQEAPPADVSPDLLRVYLQQLEDRVARVPFSGIFDLQRLRRAMGLAAGLLVMVGVFVALNQQDNSVFFQRMVGSSREWPRSTHLRLELDGSSAHWRVETDDEGRPRRVHIARGASLPVLVRAEGSVPDEVELIIEETDRHGRTAQARMIRSDLADGTFSYRFRNLTRPLRMHPRGGDDDGRRLEVEVVVSAPPTVERVEATISPPPYTGLPSIREERQEFTVPVGTRLDLEFVTSTVLKSGTVTTDGDPSTAQTLTIDPENPKRLMHSLMVQERGTLNLQLEGEDGFRNLVPLDYPIIATQDRRPTVELLRPQVSSVQVTENGVIPFRALVRDDYGVARVDLEFARFGDTVLGEINLLQSAPAQAMGQGTQGEPVSLFDSIDLESFRVPGSDGEEMALGTGQTLSYRLRIHDNREDPDRSPAPNVLESPLRGIEVVTLGEKSRKLADRQLRLRQTIATLRRSQEQKLEGLQAVAASLEEVGARELARELQALEVDETRIRNKGGQISRDFAEIVEEYVLNRLDVSSTRERVLLAWLKMMREADPRTRFDVEGLRGILAAWRAGDYGQLDVLENMLEWIEIALDASEVEAERALQKLREARVTSDVERRPALLGEAVEAEQKVIELYAQLLEKMVEWETYQEIVDQWRGLFEEQKAINQGTARPNSSEDER